MNVLVSTAMEVWPLTCRPAGTWRQAGRRPGGPGLGRAWGCWSRLPARPRCLWGQCVPPEDVVVKVKRN